MNKASILKIIRGGLIVSCQALENEPLHGSHIMARMALAAKEGGAVGIRANSGRDIRAIKEATELPVIGIVKRYYEECEIYITPTLKEVEEVFNAGAEIIAIDGTNRQRPDGSKLEKFVCSIRKEFPEILLMADISTLEEGLLASQYDVDIIAPTLSGYTSYSPQQPGPDLNLIESLVKQIPLPIIAEGKLRTPEEVVQCYEKGVWSVVVGSAITRPQEITRRFVERLKKEDGYDLFTSRKYDD
jgi:N-acylglucosamine-6-phosphate 2-epimerase